jgi:lysophosphatidate acyltransferase
LWLFFVCFCNFRSTDTLLPFKKGPFHLAIEAQCPIQPIVVSRYTFLESKRKFFGRGHSIISVLPEVKTKGMGKEDIAALVARVQSMMQMKFEELNDSMAAASSMKYF